MSGTCIGSFLRGLSKAAQAQVAKANAAGDEVISNIRTVRAFAMEDDEMEVYGTELSKARQLNENLGLGIGLFQVQKMRSSNYVLGKSCTVHYTFY